MESSNDGDNTTEILYLSFNQTSTGLCVGTKTGYMIYDLDQVYECRPTFESRGISDVSIIERFYSSSLSAYVSLHSPRTLILCLYTKGTLVSERHFPNTVLSIKMNRKNIVVCLEDTVYIYYIEDVNQGKEAHIITNIPTNRKGLIALTYGNGNSIIGYPINPESGDVQIFDATERKSKVTISAHTSQLAALCFDENGEKLATASIKGTVIRVFSTSSREILFEFRRGVKRCVEIHSLSFDQTGEFLCASSNTETVHIFKLCSAEPAEQIEEENESWMDMFGRVLTQSAKYLPTQMSDVLMQQRSFAIVHLPFMEQKTVCSICKIQNVSYIIVASMEGFMYIYELNTEIGGLCPLVKQHRLEGPFEPYLHPISSAINTLSKLTISEPIVKCTADIEKDNWTKTDEDHEINSSLEAENGIPETCDELPPLLNKVE